MEIAHIVPWAESQDNSFENLIVLCPNCHSRFDQKREIDRQSVKMYKTNLGIVNNRYGEFERRAFEILAESGERLLFVGAGGDVLLYHAIKDGFLEDKHVEGLSMTITGDNGYEKSFPMSYTYWVTDAGIDFIGRFARGEDI